MAIKPKNHPAQAYKPQPTKAPARKPYTAPNQHSTESHPFGARSEAAHYLQILPYTVNSYYRYWMFHGDTFSRADKLLLEYLIALGFTEEEAVEKLPHAKGAVHQVATSKQPISPSGDFSSANGGLPAKLPDAPPKYPYKPRMKGGIEKYLRDNWATYITAGLLSRPALKRIDPAAHKALENLLGKPGGQLPPDIYIPTKAEVNDRKLAAAADLSEIERLARAQRYRDRKKSI